MLSRHLWASTNPDRIPHCHPIRDPIAKVSRLLATTLQHSWDEIIRPQEMAKLVELPPPSSFPHAAASLRPLQHLVASPAETGLTRPTSHGTAFLGASQNSTLSPHEAATHTPARVPSCQQHPMGRQFRAPRGTRHQLLHSSIALHFSCKCTIPPSPTALRRVPAPTPYGELTGGSNPLTAPAPVSIGPPRAPAARGQDGPKLHPQWSSSFTTGSPRGSLQIHH